MEEMTMLTRGILWGITTMVSMFVLGMIAIEVILGGNHDRGTR